MKQEVADFLQAARHHLSNATAISGLHINEVAAQQAYLAAFHAAEAYVYDRTGRAAKTHSGLRASFARVAKDEPRIPRELVRFLARGFDLKVRADYAATSHAEVTAEDAAAAIETAGQFIAVIAGLLE